jgi:two-component sensor histidine kinase
MVRDFSDKLIFTNSATGVSKIIPKVINNKKISFYPSESTKDKYGRLWISSKGKGLYCYDGKNNLFIEFHHDNSKVKSLPFNLTTCLFIDRSENLWIGIDGGGVARLDLKQPKFNLFPLSEGEYSILDDYFTKCFYEDKKQRIWFGSHTNGLNILDTKTDKLANYHSGINKANCLPGNIVGSILKDADGKMWIGSSGGISLFNEKKDLFTTVVLHNVPQLQPDINIFVFKMIQLNNGDILAATAFGLIKVSKQANGRYEGYYFCDNPFLKSTATDVIEMPDGIIYASLPGNGLHKLTNTSEGYKLSHIFLTGIDLRSIRIDEKDPRYLWVSSGIGLIYFNTVTNQYKIWNTNNGLANNYVYGSLEDEKNNVWISTNGGLSYLDRADNRIENFTYQDGLQSNEFNTQAFYKSATNTFYFGGIKGFNWFRTTTFKSEQHKPQVAFTQVEVDNILFSIDSALVVNDHIELPYDKNNLNFKFAALDYTRPEANRIQYTLEGWDTKWVTTNTKSVRYSHLPPGNYTMIIKASNAAGIWSDEKRIKVTIEKPYWQTNWFYLLVILFFILVIVFATYAFVQMRVRKKVRKLEKHAAIEEERNRISKDMHDEIGNGLTHIALLSELIHAQHSPGSDIKKDINSISTSARKLVQTMSEIIWALNPQNDTLDNLLAYIREQSYQYFEGMNIAFSIQFPEVLPEIKLTNEQRRNLFLVTKEALSNAMKHSQADSIELGLEITKDEYCFTVKDNGVGMPVNKNKVGSNGLKNMKKRMEDIGGSIEWENGTKGTSVAYCLAF